MATFAPPGLLIWVAMPNGTLRTDTSAQLQLSVMLSPRLATPSNDATVDGGEFPHFDDWPATAAGLAFDIEIDSGGGAKTVLGTTVDTAQLDSAAWKALFSRLHVNTHAPGASGLAGRDFSTYNARTNYQTLAGGYEPAPRPQPGQPLSAAESRQLARVTLARALGTTADEERRLLATIDQLRQQHGVITAVRIGDVADVNIDALRFAELNSFFDGLSRGVKNRVGTPQTQPAFDFHQAVTSLARYPALMRKLGLVLDLRASIDIATLDSLPTQGRVRVALKPGVSGWTSFAPWTAYALESAAGRFVTTPASDALGVAIGMLVPADTDTAMVLDIDAIAPKIRTAVASFVNGSSQAQDIALPAPRSAGLALARDQLAATLQQMLNRQADLEDKLSSAVDGQLDMVLTTEDLLRGFRVDVRRDGDARWLSLNQRNGSYTLLDGTGLMNSVDEGFISLQAFNPDADAAPVLYAHESLFRWTGWSLSVPRPGKTIGSDGQPIARNDQATSNLPIRVDFTPVASTLPRLRLGEGYDCRLRAVDLAGNSLALDAATPEEFTFRLGKYLRFDPLIAPTLAMRDALKPAESVDNVVITSERDAPATETAERLVASPKTSVQMAEWHGMFDTATGVDPGAYQTIVAQDGSFAEGPYGASVPRLPYLPDPVARGASLREIVPNATTQADPVKVPFDGPWPACEPFRLRLIEGDAAPAWDAAQRVFAVSLPKGRTKTYGLGCYRDTGTLGDTPADDDVKDLAVFNYWNGIVDPRRRRPPADRKVLWAEVAAGRNEQLTPHRTLTLVHAVPTPLLAPSLDASNVSVTRPVGSTDAVIDTTTVVDLSSTGQIDMMSEWSESFDDGVNSPQNTRFSANAHLGRLTVDPNSIDIATRFKTHHEFHDTKHRKITCWFVASTRYAEYFPANATAPQLSGKVTIDVPCSARPLPPKVLYVVPTFGWQQGSTDDGGTRCERRVGLRVYLDRPWYSSGDGEQLAVRMAMEPVPIEPSGNGDPRPPPGPRPFAAQAIVPNPPRDIADEDAPFVTQWGTDPAFVSGSIASPFTPLPRHFPNAKSTEFELTSDGVTLGDSSTYKYVHATFDVAFEPPDPSDPGRPADPTRDPHNGRWYCDIDIDAGVPYFPFVRLALVRFQPSGQFWDPEGLIFFDMRFSRPALVDFVQLAPGRTLTIVPEMADPALLHVAITGASFVPNEALGNLTRLPPSLTVGVEMNVGAAGAPLWIPISSTDLSPASASPADPGSMTWRGDVRLPFAQGSKPMRLTAREYETLPADPSSRDLDLASTLVQRLVFAATVELTSPSYVFSSVDFPGATSTFLQGTNNAGQIVGYQRDANGALHGVLTDTTAFDTFDPPGFASAFPGTSFADGINDSGEIVGGVKNNDNSGAQAYVRDSGTFSLYSYPQAGPSGTTVFEGINNAGIRVGAYSDETGTPHGIIQTGDGTTLLEELLRVPPNTGTFIFDINNVGQMVGGYFDPVLDVQHGFMTDGSTFRTIDFKGSSFTWLNGINDRGEMVGAYFDDVTQLWHGFLTDGNTFTVLDAPDVPGQHPGTFPTGIDNTGRIVGYYGDDLDSENKAGIRGFVARPASAAAVSPPVNRS